MSWYSKVAWSEGLFLRQHHLQQNDRYLEKLIDRRTRFSSPYPWGFSELEVDLDMAAQKKFALRRVAGNFQDGYAFDCPTISPLPTPIEIPEGSEKSYVWLTLPNAVANTREIDMGVAQSGSRYVREAETIIDSNSNMHQEEQIEVAHPRLSFDIRKTEKPGFHCLKIARILEIQDKRVIFDQTFAPPVLVVAGDKTVTGWMDRVIGWVDTKLETLSRYAADPSSGGGLQTFDYFMLQLLNREINVLKFLRASPYVHPSEFYIQLLRLSGELWTFSPKRLAPAYQPYDQDNLAACFEPILSDIQRLLSLDIGRAIRLELVERAQNAYIAMVNDRSLFKVATFVIEVSASRPLTEIQRQFSSLCKVGPTRKMNQLVNTHLPGIDLIHLPTPPGQIRAVSDHVYFRLDKYSDLWPEFSSDPGIGLHFAGDWPNLELDLWAIMDSQS
nr:type VI secretion system baseplate subunit TssK [uncultured Cohaesibacter sp.]